MPPPTQIGNTYTPSAPQLKLYADGEELVGSHVRRIQRFAGGAAGDRIAIELARTESLVDTSILFAAQEVEVYLTKQTGGGSTGKRLFWGWTSGLVYSLTTETVTFEARVARFHFGKPLEGMDEWRRVAGSGVVATIEQDLVFNPYEDGITRGNMRGDADDGLGKRALFLDPDSVRSPSARTWQQVPWIDDLEFKEAEPERLWTVAKAVHYLCWTLNADEKYIDNPALKDLEELFGTATSDLREVRIPIGRYLSEALDSLLRPLGYGWYLSYEPAKPTLRFFGRGRGPGKAVTLAKPRSPFGWENDLKRAQLAVGYQSLVNEVVVLGGLEQVECSIELFPAWRSGYDLSEEDDLDKASDVYRNEPEIQRVGRDFVANEGGDYNGQRPGLERPLSMRLLFGRDLVAKRRRIYPCLTLGADGAPLGQNGYVLKWRVWDRTQPVSLQDTTWKPIEELEYGSVHILRNEIGIRFDGQLPPAEVLDDMAHFQVQITGTLFGDQRVRGTAARRETSPQALTVREVVKDDDAFQKRTIGIGSEYYVSALESKIPAGEDLTNDAVDDSEAAAAKAEALRFAWDQADVSGQLAVALLDGEDYEIGDVITGIVGRAISFAASDGSRYPQVTAIDYDIEAQERILTIATMRDEG
jgi:hypothetical protein